MDWIAFYSDSVLCKRVVEKGGRSGRIQFCRGFVKGVVEKLNLTESPLFSTTLSEFVICRLSLFVV